MPEAAYDVLVVGGGPGGSACAIELAQRGHRVLVAEKSEFPRYHIGESLTGTAGDYITRTGLEPEMARRDFPAKPGVRVVGRNARHEFYVPVLRPTWQVRRDEFDQLLLDRARDRGVEVTTAKVVDVDCDDRGRPQTATLEFEGGSSRSVAMRMLVDASGQSALLSKLGVAGKRRVGAFSRQIAVYSQFSDVVLDAGELTDATVIYYGDVHHWAWVIPLGRGLVSIGVVVPTQAYRDYGDRPQAVLRWGVEHLNPELSERVRQARRCEAVRASRNYSYQIDPFAGPGWLCVGDAHAFCDPIFSFGASFALSEGETAAKAIARMLAEPGSEADELGAYARYARRGQQRASELIRYFWKFPAFFAFMTRGSFGDDIIRLLAGDCFTDDELPASTEMRASLKASPSLDNLPEGPVREVATRIFRQFDFFQGVDAAFVDDRRPRALEVWLSVPEGDPQVLAMAVDIQTELCAEHPFPVALRPTRTSTEENSAFVTRRDHMSTIFDRRPR